MHKAWLSLGSNKGDREGYLHMAIERLEAHPQIHITKKSSIYRTAAWGPVPQEDFLNAVSELETSLPPLALLDVCQSIEMAAGRKRDVRWGARTLDIDILYYDRLRMEEERLTLPQPNIEKRRFVLVPLAEIVEDEPLKQEVQTMLLCCEDALAVERLIPAHAW